jgi:hypothetical protein
VVPLLRFSKPKESDIIVLCTGNVVDSLGEEQIRNILSRSVLATQAEVALRTAFIETDGTPDFRINVYSQGPWNPFGSAVVIKGAKDDPDLARSRNRIPRRAWPVPAMPAPPVPTGNYQQPTRVAPLDPDPPSYIAQYPAMQPAMSAPVQLQPSKPKSSFPRSARIILGVVLILGAVGWVAMQQPGSLPDAPMAPRAINPSSDFDRLQHAGQGTNGTISLSEISGPGELVPRGSDLFSVGAAGGNCRYQWGCSQLEAGWFDSPFSQMTRFTLFDLPVGQKVTIWVRAISPSGDTAVRSHDIVLIAQPRSSRNQPRSPKKPKKSEDGGEWHFWGPSDSANDLPPGGSKPGTF